MTKTAASASAEIEPVRLPPDVAEAALEFLSRVPLHASEVEAFMRVRVALQMIAVRGAQ